MPEPELPAIYAEATVGLVLSMTNYSLVAQEMLSCGLACVELDAPSVVAAFGRGGPVDFAPLDPIAIADALERLLTDPELRADRAAQGVCCVRSARGITRRPRSTRAYAQRSPTPTATAGRCSHAGAATPARRGWRGHVAWRRAGGAVGAGGAAAGRTGAAGRARGRRC